MAILKYYKVDSDGKIKRLRRECPAAECGAGVFVSLDISPTVYDSVSNYSCLDGIPQRSPILRPLRLDIHVPARHQTACGLTSLVGKKEGRFSCVLCYRLCLCNADEY
jgi:hypothetical protein